MNWVGRIKHNTQQIPLETKDEKNHSIKMKGLSMGMTSPVLIPIKCADIVIASRFFRIYDIYKIGESGTIRKEKWLYYMLKILQIQFQHCNSAFCFKEKSFTLVALRNILAHRAPETPSEHLFYTHQKKRTISPASSQTVPLKFISQQQQQAIWFPTNTVAQFPYFESKITTL